MRGKGPVKGKQYLKVGGQYVPRDWSCQVFLTWCPDMACRSHIKCPVEFARGMSAIK